MTQPLSPEEKDSRAFERLTVDNARLRTLNRRLLRYGGFAFENVIDELREELKKSNSLILPKTEELKLITPSNTNHTEIASVLLSDWHVGEVINPDEINGVNKYNSVISANRVWELVQKIKKIISIHQKVYPISKIWLPILGDMCFPKGSNVTLEDGTIKPIEMISLDDLVVSASGVGKVKKVHERDYDSAKEGKFIKLNVNKNIAIAGTSEHKVLVIPREVVETGHYFIKKRENYNIEKDFENVFKSSFEFRAFKDIRPRDYVLSRSVRSRAGELELDVSEITGLPLQKDINGSLFKKVRGTSPAVSCSKIKITPEFLRFIGLFVAEGSCMLGRSGLTNCAIFTLHTDEIEHAKEIQKYVKNIFGYEVIFRENLKAHTRNVYINNQIIATFLKNLVGEGAKHKVISKYLWEYPGSLLPLVCGWLDGDGNYACYAKIKTSGIIGKTISRNLANQIVNICREEKLSVGLQEELPYKNSRRNIVYLVRFNSDAAQTIASYSSLKFDYRKFFPVYDESFFVGDYLASRVKNISEENYVGKVYDLTIEDDHTYNINNIIVHNCAGSIHPELELSNDLSDPAISILVSRLLFLLINELRIFGIPIQIDCIVGNHGRLTAKMPTKRIAQTNYDWVIYEIVSSLFKDVKDVNVNIHVSSVVPVILLGWKYVLMHGTDVRKDKLTNLEDFVRAIFDDKEFRSTSKQLGTTFDQILLGHLHKRITQEKITVNGALSGQSELGVSWMLKPIRAQQVMFGISKSNIKTWEYALDVTNIKNEVAYNPFSKYTKEFLKKHSR